MCLCVFCTHIHPALLFLHRFIYAAICKHFIAQHFILLERDFVARLYSIRCHCRQCIRVFAIYVVLCKNYVLLAAGSMQPTHKCPKKKKKREIRMKWCVSSLLAELNFSSPRIQYALIHSFLWNCQLSHSPFPFSELPAQLLPFLFRTFYSLIYLFLKNFIFKMSEFKAHTIRAFYMWNDDIWRQSNQTQLRQCLRCEQVLL